MHVFLSNQRVLAASRFCISMDRLVSLFPFFVLRTNRQTRMDSDSPGWTQTDQDGLRLIRIDPDRPRRTLIDPDGPGQTQILCF